MSVRLTGVAVATLVVVALLLGEPGPGEAQSNPPAIKVDKARGNRGVDHAVEGGRTDDGAFARTGGAGVRRRPSTGPVFYATFPTLETDAAGSPCLRIRRERFTSEAAARSAEDTENLLWRLAAASFPLCPRTPAPTNTPAAQAAEFWRVVGEDKLPSPDPDIQPGFMLAGKLAYLEAGTVPSARFENPTPAGMLTIEATAQTYVDWGDGSAIDGPFDHPGGPWPHGTITHYWTEIGHYDITVVQRWTARWSLGADSGELAGLETVGVIDDFPIEELQAVINRG